MFNLIVGAVRALLVCISVTPRGARPTLTLDKGRVEASSGTEMVEPVFGAMTKELVIKQNRQR